MFRATLLATVLLAGCAGPKVLTTTAVSTPPLADGSADEWDELQRLESGKLLLGVHRDAEYLYLALVTSDPTTIRQITTGGLQIWIDPDGGEDQLSGVRYPLGFIHYNRGRRGQMPLPGGDIAPEMLARMFEETTAELDVLGEDGSAVRVRQAAVEGLAAAARMDMGTLTAELAIPMAGPGELTFGPAEATIGLGLMAGGGAGAGRGVAGLSSPGGRGGRGGGRGGRGGRGGGGRGGARAGGGPGGGGEPLELWVQVALGG